MTLLTTINPTIMEEDKFSKTIRVYLENLKEKGAIQAEKKKQLGGEKLFLIVYGLIRMDYRKDFATIRQSGHRLIRIT